MKLTKRLLLGGALVLAAAPSFAQFTLDGELRPRFEYRHGYKNVADSAQDNAAFIQQRTRLNFGYKAEGYIFKMSIQDLRVWGDQKQLVSTNGGKLQVHEAWGEALMTDKLSLKVGRQEIIFDDHRIFGSVNWTAQGRSHDAAMFKVKTDKLKMNIGFAWNQDGAGLVGTDAFNGSYKAFQVLHANYKVNDAFNASLLFLNNGKQQLDSTRFTDANAVTIAKGYYKDNYSQTVGTKLNYKKDKLTIGANFYSQMGVNGGSAERFDKLGNDYDEKISAMLYGIDISYKITDKFTAGIGYEYQSGQSQTDTTNSYVSTNHAFTPFYGTNHKFNGLMDQFYVGAGHGNVGLQDINVKLKYKAEKFWVGAAVHMFAATADVWDKFKYNTDLTAANDAMTAATTQAQTDAAQAQIDGVVDTRYTSYDMEKSLGTEIDLTFGFNLAKGVAFKGGYSMLMATETLAYLKGAQKDEINVVGGAPTDFVGQGRTDQTSNWAWAMLVFKPKFITGEAKK